MNGAYTAPLKPGWFRTNTVSLPIFLRLELVFHILDPSGALVHFGQFR